MTCTNESNPYFYFIISRSINNKDDIYGKFGNCKNINFEKRFISYSTNNPSYFRVCVPYDKAIMQRLGTQYECLDNYINNKVLLKMSSVPKVHFLLSRSEKTKTDWFFVTEKTAYNIMLYMVHFNESRHSHHIDNVKDCMCFVKKLRILLQDDIVYAIKCINDNSTNGFDDNFKYSNLCTTFMHKFYKEGGIISLQRVRSHPDWIREYETYITTKFINMCKSCKNKAHNNCCPEYSPINRAKIKMVIGWSE